MVLRKSEYRKNFKWISSEKRHALWLENTLYRHDRRLREFGHQPLGWDSDPDDVPDSESEDCGLPPTKLRQRRLQLLEIAGERETPPPQRRRRRPRYPWAWGLGWFVCVSFFFSSSVLFISLVSVRRPQEVFTRDTATQTERDCGRERGPYVTDGGKEAASLPGRQSRQRTVSHGAGGASQRELRVHCPSHGPFENYGWADEVDTVSAKRTFNVGASTTEVYPSALMAARLRHRSPTPPPKRKTFRPQRPRSAPPKAHHHVWISEYRDQYQ
uniref:Putative conserved protein with signal anchor n=1 Tax=Ixodes ricinus TaxID=34613 RepID=A0A6B0V6M4_IXORI